MWDKKKMQKNEKELNKHNCLLINIRRWLKI